MRIICVDPGEKKIGVAISDPTGTLARPLTLIEHISRTIDLKQVSPLKRWIKMLRKVLVVDDEQDYRDLMVMHLRRKKYGVDGASDGAEALELLKNNPNHYAVLVTDWLMPGFSGNELVRQAKLIDPFIEAIIITAHGQMGLAGKLGFNAFGFLVKTTSLNGRAFKDGRTRFYSSEGNEG